MQTRSPQHWLPLIQKIKDKLKTDPTLLEICQEYDFDPADIDLVPVKFDDIDVSARTDKGVISLNWKLLETPEEISSYILHEFQHYVSQSVKPTQSADDGNYLSNPDEQIAFQRQIQYLDDHYGKEKAEDYVTQVLDHHGESGEDRQDKKEILLEKIEFLTDRFLYKLSIYSGK